MPGEFSGEMPSTPPGAFPGKREKRENLVKCKVVGCLALSAGAKTLYKYKVFGSLALSEDAKTL